MRPPDYYTATVDLALGFMLGALTLGVLLVVGAGIGGWLWAQ